MTLITQMIGHLDLQARLEHLADQARQQTALAGQPHTLGAGPATKSSAQSLIAASPTASLAGNADRI